MQKLTKNWKVVMKLYDESTSLSLTHNFNFKIPPSEGEILEKYRDLQSKFKWAKIEIHIEEFYLVENERSSTEKWSELYEKCETSKRN